MKVWTTFKLLRDGGACEKRYKHLARKLGGVKKYGINRPISFLTILKHNGYADTEWATYCTKDKHKTTIYNFHISLRNAIYRLQLTDSIANRIHLFKLYYTKMNKGEFDQ